MKSLLVFFLTVITAQATFAAPRSQSCYTPGKDLTTHYWAQVSDKKVTVMYATTSPMYLNHVANEPTGAVSNEQVVHVYRQVENNGAVTVNGMTAKVSVSTLTGQILKVELFYGGVVPSAKPIQTLTECKDSI